MTKQNNAFEQKNQVSIFFAPSIVSCVPSQYLFRCNLRLSVFPVFLLALNDKNATRIVGINAQLWPKYDYFIVNMLQDLIDMSIRRKIE